MSVTIHQSGIDAAIAAQANGFSGAELSRVELWSQSSKIKDLPLKGVKVIEPGRIYVVATDSSTDAYACYALKFYTDTDVLYATVTDGSIIQSKAEKSSVLFSYAVNINSAPGTIVSSGDLSLYAPPADEEEFGTVIYAKDENLIQKTEKRKVLSPFWLWKWWDSVRDFTNIKNVPSASESKKGIIEIATQTETDTGVSNTRAITPKKLKDWFEKQDTFSEGDLPPNLARLPDLPLYRLSENQTLSDLKSELEDSEDSRRYLDEWTSGSFVDVTLEARIDSGLERNEFRYRSIDDSPATQLLFDQLLGSADEYLSTARNIHVANVKWTRDAFAFQSEAHNCPVVTFAAFVYIKAGSFAGLAPGQWHLYGETFDNSDGQGVRQPQMNLTGAGEILVALPAVVSGRVDLSSFHNWHYFPYLPDDLESKISSIYSSIGYKATRTSVDAIKRTYVQDIRFGTYEIHVTYNKAIDTYIQGWVIVSVQKDHYDYQIDSVRRAPVQKKINNIWYTVGI